jgi:DNA-directed RNA polymerase specialized sigma subunit
MTDGRKKVPTLSNPSEYAQAVYEAARDAEEGDGAELRAVLARAIADGANLEELSTARKAGEHERAVRAERELGRELEKAAKRLADARQAHRELIYAALDAGMTSRAIAPLAGISHQRVAQLAAERRDGPPS